MGTTAYNIGALVATMGLDTTQYQAGMASVSASAKAADAATKTAATSMSASMAAAGAKMQAVGKKMQRYLTIPILAAGVASTKVFSDFESSMAKITGLVGVAKSQVEEWKTEVLALGPATAQGPDKLAEALFYITSAGIRGSEAMEVLEMAAKAATSGLGEASVVADLVTSAMNAYGKENLNAAQATDILVATVKEGKAEASSLAAAMGMVLPIASEYGVTFDQVGAAFAGMTRTGTNARVAATQLKAILSSMASPALKAEGAMQKYGTSSAEFRKTIEEEGLIVALQNLKTAVNGNKVAMAEIFPNIRGLMGVLDLLGKNAEQNVAIFESLTNAEGSLDAAFESASDTMKFRFNEALATMKTKMITLGTTLSGTLIPLIEKLTTWLSDSTEKWNAMTEGQQKNKIKVIALTAAMGPLLKITGSLIKMLSTPKGPYAMAIAGAIALTLAVRKLVLKHREEKEQLDAVQTANAKVNSAYETQAAKISYLAAIIEDENISNDGRIAAIEELKRIMPGYNADLTDEGVLLNHNTTEIEDYLVQLKEKIKLQIYEKEYTDILKQQVQAQRDLDKATTAARIAQEKYDESGGKDYQTISTSGMGGVSGMVGASVQNVTAERNALNEANAELNARAVAVEEAAQAQADLTAEMEKMNIVLSDGGSVSGGGGGNGGGGGTNPIVDDGATAFLEKQAQARIDLARFIADEELELYVDMYQKRAAAEQLSYERSKSLLEQQGTEGLLTEAEVNAGIEALELAHQARMEKIAYEGADAAIAAQKTIDDTKKQADAKEEARKDKIRSDEQKAWDEKITNTMAYLQVGSEAISALSDLSQISMAKELAAAGSNTAAQEKIKKAYYEKEKKWAIAQAIINGALGATQAWAQEGPLGFIGAAVVAAATAIEVAAISAQTFADGGLAYGPTLGLVGEYPGAQSNPEVIAPLSDLQAILKNSGSSSDGGTVTFKIEGRTLVGVLQKEDTYTNTY